MAKERLFIIVVQYIEDTSLKTKSRDLGAIQLRVKFDI